VTRDELAQTIGELGGRHSPSGVEEPIDAYLIERLSGYGTPATDTAGNIVLRIEGREPGPLRAVLAHKDEIGAMVKRVEDRGRLRVGKLGGSFPWVWGEGPVDVLGRHATVTGILSFGSRHVSKESAHREQQESAGVRWQDAWVETKLDAAARKAARALRRDDIAARIGELQAASADFQAAVKDLDASTSGLKKEAAKLRAEKFTAAVSSLTDTIGSLKNLSQVIETDDGDKIAAAIKDAKLKKVQASIQGEQVRISGPSRDDLQEAIALLKGKDFGVQLQFGNYR